METKPIDGKTRVCVRLEGQEPFEWYSERQKVSSKNKQVSTKGKLGVEKEQNGVVLAKEVRGNVTLLGKVLYIKVGFITVFVHSS